MLQRANQNLCNIWNWFISTDPGLIRLRMATWAVLTAGISYLILSYVSELMNQPPAVSLLGVIVGVSAIAVNDPDVPDQRITTLLIPLPALMAVVLGELASPIPLIRELVLLGVIFAAVRMRQFGARGTVLGLVIFMTYLFSFNLGLQANQLPWAVTAILLGTLTAFLVRFVILPGRPAVIFHQSVRAFQASINTLLAELIDLLQNLQRQDEYCQILRRQLYKIGDLAIDLENLLGPRQDIAAAEDLVEVWRTDLLEVEMALETLVDVTGQIVQEKSISPEKLAGLANLFRILQASVQSNTPEQPLQADILQTYHLKPDGSALNLAFSRMEWAAQTLIEHDVWQIPMEVEEHLNTSNLVSPHPPASQASADNLKLAVQATLAVGIAILVGVLISGTRWYWAVIASFVLFVRASTIEETFSRAWQRVAGTLVGVVVGIFLVQVIIDDPRLEVILLLAGFFTAYFLATLTYTGFVFVLTVVLAILYRLLGTFQPGLLVVRLEETLAGAAVGFLVALFIFPKFSSTKNQENMTKVLQKISQAFEPMIPDTERAELFDQLRSTVREIDQQLILLRCGLSSLGGRFLSLSSPTTRERVHKLSLLGIAIRHYLVASRLSQPDSQFQQQTSLIERSLAENAMLIANALEDQTSPTIQPPENLLMQDLPARAATAYTPEQGAALQWLARISQLQSEIAQDLQI
jgi:uncharacterized membrane protein YgaE (UPF0421/DUF939 family)